MIDDNRTVRSPTLRITAWTIVVLFVTIVVGSWIGKTEIVARGTGRIIVDGRTQTVQPQFPGQVANILVNEGDTVRAGDELVLLNPIELESEIERLNATHRQQIREQNTSLAVLEPLISLDPASGQFIERGIKAFTSTHAGLLPDQAVMDIKLVRSVLVAIRDRVAEADANILRYESGLLTHAARVDQVNAQLEILTEHSDSAEALQKTGTISRAVYLERLREKRVTEHEARIVSNRKDELRAQLTSAQQARRNIITLAIADYRQRAAEADIALQGIKAELSAAQDRLRNSRIVAPVTGRIDDLKVHTTGSFVTAGQQLMSVVPDGTRLEIEAFFKNRDAGFLEVGQAVFIKLDAFPAERFGFVTGSVRNISADARKDPSKSIPGNLADLAKIAEAGTTGEWVYAVRISFDQPYVERDGKRHDFMPGMTGTIDVVTGERRLISYFFEPLTKAIQDGFGER